VKSVTLEISPLVETLLDIQAMQDVLEKEAMRRWHVNRSRKLTPKEKELRAFLGKAAYDQLTPAEKERMLASIELPT